MWHTDRKWEVDDLINFLKNSKNYFLNYGYWVYLDPNEMSGRSYFCTCPQTILFWAYFPQMNISGKQNQSQKRCEARDVSNAQTDVSLRHSHVHDPDHTACVTKFTL